MASGKRHLQHGPKEAQHSLSIQATSLTSANCGQATRVPIQVARGICSVRVSIQDKQHPS